jgi:hypothetical protein
MLWQYVKCQTAKWHSPKNLGCVGANHGIGVSGLNNQPPELPVKAQRWGITQLDSMTHSGGGGGGRDQGTYSQYFIFFVT